MAHRGGLRDTAPVGPPRPATTTNVLASSALSPHGVNLSLPWGSPSGRRRGSGLSGPRGDDDGARGAHRRVPATSGRPSLAPRARPHPPRGPSRRPLWSAVIVRRTGTSAGALGASGSTTRDGPRPPPWRHRRWATIASRVGLGDGVRSAPLPGGRTRGRGSGERPGVTSARARRPPRTPPRSRG